MILTHHGIDSLRRSGGGDDSIGGRIYRTVTIGGKVWLAENLDYKFSGLVVGQGASSSEPRANYYQNNEATYGESGNKYGLLYNWIAINYLEQNKAQLCQGWHVPTTAEWNELISNVGGDSVAGRNLKSTTGWNGGGNGTDAYEFTAYPAGDMISGSFYDLGNYCYFWTATQSSTTNAYARWMNDGNAIFVSNLIKSFGFPVRLVKDY